MIHYIETRLNLKDDFQITIIINKSHDKPLIWGHKHLRMTPQYNSIDNFFAYLKNNERGFPYPQEQERLKIRETLRKIKLLCQ